MASLNILGIGDEEEPGTLLGIPGARVLNVSLPNPNPPTHGETPATGGAAQVYNTVTDLIEKQRQRALNEGEWTDGEVWAGGPEMAKGLLDLLPDDLNADAAATAALTGMPRQGVDVVDGTVDAPLFASPPPAEPPEEARIRDLFSEAAQ